LVLLPGLDGTEVFFGPLLSRLPSWINPIVVTYPAFGPNTSQDLVPIVNRAVRKLTDFVILGWSFGGPLALMIAAQRPSQTAGVILCASFVTPPHPGLIPFRFAVTAPVIATVRAIRRTRLLIPGYATWMRGHNRFHYREIMNTAAAFGQVLRRLRVEAGYSQEKLGSEANLRRTYISILERGQQQPTLTTILKLSRALNRPASDLIRLVEAEIRSEARRK